MKTCIKCGATADDKEYICPACGADLVKKTNFALKPQEEKKKVANPMGTSVSTGSGLTDILRAGDDEDGVDNDDFVAGSIPIALSKTIIDDSDYKVKRKSKLIPNIIKLVLLLLVLFGIYYVVTQVILKDVGAKSKESVVKIYIEAINDDDVDRFKVIVPAYVGDAKGVSSDLINEMEDIHIDGYDIIEANEFDTDALNKLTEGIKFQTTKTANISEAYELKVSFTAHAEDDTSNTFNTTTTMVVVKIRDSWYLNVIDYVNPIFDRE
ncbi:MAG: hypothetical protein ACI4D8_09110 [Wujia sp.]